MADSKSFTAKALKQDNVREILLRFFAAALRWRWYLGAGLGTLVLLGGALGIWQYSNAQARMQANADFSALEQQTRAVNTIAAVQGEGSAALPITQELREQWIRFAEKHPASVLAAVAWLRVAEGAWLAADHQAAQEAFQRVAENAQATAAQRALAGIGLAKTQTAPESRVAHYAALPEGAWMPIKAYYQGQLALQEGREQEARRHFEALAQAQESPLARIGNIALRYLPAAEASSEAQKTSAAEEEARGAAPPPAAKDAP